MPSETRIVSRCSSLGYQGLSEGYSLGLLLKQVRADQIVAVNGSIEETKSLADVLQTDKFIQANYNGNWVGNLRISSLKAEAPDLPVQKIKFRLAGNDELECALVSGNVRIKPASSSLSKQSDLSTVDYSTLSIFDKQNPSTSSLAGAA